MKGKSKITLLLVLTALAVIASYGICHVKADNFGSLTVTPQSVGSDMVYPGETAYYTVTVTGDGAQATWDLTINTPNNLPIGYTAVFTPKTIGSASGVATLAITIPQNAPIGISSFSVHAYDDHDGNPTGNSASTNLTTKLPLELPEYPLAGLAAILSCFGAFVVFKKRDSLRNFA